MIPVDFVGAPDYNVTLEHLISIVYLGVMVFVGYLMYRSRAG